MQSICVFCSTEFCSNQLMEEVRAVGEESALHVCSNNSEGSLAFALVVVKLQTVIRIRSLYFCLLLNMNFFFKK